MLLSQLNLVTKVAADRQRYITDLDFLLDNAKVHIFERGEDAYKEAIENKLDLIGGAEMTLVDLGVVLDDESVAAR